MVTGFTTGYQCIAKGEGFIATNEFEVPFSTVVRNRAEPEETILWGLHKITGLWKVLRTCQVENAEKWLDIFSNDESEKSIYSEFKVSKKRPIYKRKGK